MSVARVDERSFDHARVALSIAHECGYGERREHLVECTEDRVCDKSCVSFVREGREVGRWCQ